MVMPAYEDKWLVTIEIETYDGDPKEWAWSKILVGDKCEVISSDFKGRVIEGEGEN